MKKSYHKSFTLKLCALLGVIAVILVIHSCRKENNSDSQQTAQIAAAKSWYESVYATSSSTNGKLIIESTGGSHDLTQWIKPDWKHTATYVRNNKNVIEMPIEPSAKFGSTLHLGNNA